MRIRTLLLALALATAAAAEQAKVPSLLEARKGCQTKLVREDRDDEKLAVPDAEFSQLVHCPTPLGKMAGYLGKPANPGVKAPAILWITGGSPPGGIDESAWQSPDNANEQSAQAYRHAGYTRAPPPPLNSPPSTRWTTRAGRQSRDAPGEP